MIQLLKEIILDAQEYLLFTGVTRHLEVFPVSRKATIVIGVRRCGKSTYLNQIVNHLRSQGVKQENILYLNFFDDRLSNLKNDGLGKVLEAYFLLYPEKKNGERIYCFFDEIQVIPGWEAFIDRTLRTENCEVYITGSSANMLASEIATQMRGRALSWELFPFSFREFLDYHNIKSGSPLNTQARLSIQKAFDFYLEKGGFPEGFNVEKFLRVKIHQEYFNSILFRDLIERHDISHPRAIVDLAQRLIENTASLYTLNSLTNYLKSLGHKVPKSSVSEYISWFEDAYFLFTVRIFDASLSKSNANPKKIYCIDHAMVKSVTSGILINSGHLLENLVFVALRRFYYNIYYYKTRGNLEIDFLVQTQRRKKMLFQVSESLVNPATRHRELQSLQIAMSELGLTSATIITLYEQEQIKTEQGMVEIIPVWKFLLEELEG
ncbi:MAG: ATP-binding protein [Bacteroidetes bacterium]|nr:ATP-binding protein [Bacteroidota bacterium]